MREVKDSSITHQEMNFLAKMKSPLKWTKKLNNSRFQPTSCIRQRIYSLAMATLSLLSFFIHPSSAQNVPAPILPLPAPEPPPEIEPLPPLEDILPSPQLPQTPELTPESIPDTITVQQFEVIGSTVFSSEELSVVLEPYTNRPISFTELLQAQQVVTELYFQRGYITSGAYIPPQTIENGIVRIEVIEGGLEAIEVTGLKRLNPNYVRSRIAVATVTPLNQNSLLNALQLLQLDPLISRLSAELSAGSRPGASILTITVQEAPAFVLRLGFDNQRVASVGTDRRLVTITHNNLLGFGDRFNIQYYNTDGSNAIDDLSYTVPINPYNGTVSFRYRLTDSEVIEEPFDVLDIDSSYREYDFGFRQPILQTPNRDFSIGLNINQRESDTSVLDDLFEGETRITTLRLYQEYVDRNNRQVIAARSQFSWGFEAFELDLDGNKSNSDFFAWRGQFQYFRLLTSDMVLLFRTDIQLSNHSLLPLEQFSLGGQYSVRGYPQDVLLADNGILASLEFRNTILRISQWQTSLQLAYFFDFGTVWNTDGRDVFASSLYSVGLGLELAIGDNFNARIDYGIPLNDLDIEKNSLQEEGFYFTIEYRVLRF